MIRKLFFGGAGGGGKVADLGLLVLRLFAGLTLAIAHGRGKMPPSSEFIAGTGEMGFPAPALFAWMAALSELVGGVFLAIGFATRPAAFLIACTMMTAGFVRHAADPFGRRELAFLYLAVAIMFMLTGAGRYSVDGTLLRR